MTHSVLTLSHDVRLAYHCYQPEKAAKLGKSQVGVMFLGGYRSDMQGSKALFLEGWCRERRIAFIRFDYQGHGQSSGKFEEGAIGIWRDDALAVLDQVAEGPQVLVGSSMGGWLMLLCALKRQERVAGLLGIAAAPDFTETMMWNAFDERQKMAVMEEGVYYLPADYCPDPNALPEPYPITRKLIEDGRDHLLLKGDASIPLTCPVTLLHGMQDADVPYQTSLKLAEALQSEQVDVRLQKNGDHRMSTEASLRLLGDALGGLLQQV